MRHHVNRFGRYSLDVNRQPPVLDFAVPVFSDEPQQVALKADSGSGNN